MGFCLETSAQSERERRTLSAFYSEKILVVTSSRSPKPVTQSAENITVVSADEIEAMNAHTVAEVLNRVPGVFVNFTQDFGAVSLVNIQGSEERHVLVLLDGIRWNFIGGGNAETNTIPVGIIQRIEIIKGPASSAWGSSLGGVINIITKDVGATKRPATTIRLSAGEAASLDYSAQLSGKVSNLGYYLYAGRQESDGLWGSRDYDNNRFFSKFKLTLSEDVTAGFSMGYSEPNADLGDFPASDLHDQAEQETYYAKASFTARLTDQTEVHASGYFIDQDSAFKDTLLGLTPLGSAGNLFQNRFYDEDTCGGHLKLVHRSGNHTLVAGMEYDHGELEQTLVAGDFLQAMGLPAVTRTSPDVEEWAVYVNDTLLVGKWAITPGVRFDDNDVSGSFFSPSLGVTYQLHENSVLRATVSRGFHYPPLSYSEGGGFFLDPNPSLDAEEVWSYQAGFETLIGNTLWLKTSFFFHDQDKAITGVPYGGGPPNYNDTYVNSGDLERKGVEVELKTTPIFHMTLGASGAYARIETEGATGSSEKWAAGLLVEYNDPRTFRAQLHGRYLDWDQSPAFRANNDDMIWDVNLVKNFSLSGGHRSTAFFFTAHNLLNGSQYTYGGSKNPKRWIEAGVQWTY